MMLKKGLLVAATTMALGLGVMSCSGDQPVEEAVQPGAGDVASPGPETPTVTEFAPAVVYFAFDDYTLNSESQEKLSKLGEHLKSAQAAVLQVEGHCDERGSIEYNLALGERRAQSVKNYLSQLGIDPARLTTISYGEEKPVADGHDESAWSRNRRAEFVISQHQ